MLPAIVIPEDWPAHRQLRRLADEQRIVMLAGLPGVGKSLYVQQLALFAQRAGRFVHLLQWDVTRAAFETPDVLARFPEIDGFTHPAIKRGIGTWARQGVLAWHERHPSSAHLLIAEVALVGNRLMSLVEPQEDAVEPLLAGPDTRVVLPVPSREVRRTIEAARDRTMSTPRHEREAADAPPNVLRALWEEVYREGARLDSTTAPPPGPIAYDPDVYRRVFHHWLRHRRTDTLEIDRVLSNGGSVYDTGHIASELRATPGEVAAIMAAADPSA